MGLADTAAQPIAPDPVATLAMRLEDFGRRVAFVETDLYAVNVLTQQLVMDALADPAADFPVVLVDNEVVCVGVIDVGAVMEVVERRSKHSE